MQKMVLSILIDNTPGALSRVVGLFSRRGYNIDSLTVGETEKAEVSRMTVAVTGDGIVLDQIEKQIHKLENVIDVEKLSGEASVCRELILVKVAASREERPSINAIVEIFRAKIVDVAADSMMIELTGNQAKLNAFTKLLDGYEIKELVRTGITGLTRGFLTEQA
ncbi:MAG: acetolactate synthase small subunit [Clostridiales bacterium]|nr:acetolactate synthase small subunit [Eubacterium sp.]MDD5994460.1 acetolactate synthase small subunit [Clostridiales bacterium]MDD7349954.1 acetolactate synthase small subunit [Clostridiales bacterium]MDY3773800.1 acetolactate synthase small subunit [Eubacterium sp.]